MLEKGGTELSAGRKSNLVGHPRPQYEVSQHKVSEAKSQIEIYSPPGECFFVISSTLVGPTLFVCIVIM